MEPAEYGDLTELNKTQGILRHVGKETLANIAKSYLDLLDTSSAIYEADGSYASALFSSSYCKFMDRTSRGLCGNGDDSAALASGKWLCHESCWTDCSRRAVETGEPFDLRGCKGGINIYAVPIKAEGKTIGAINVGYGNPPGEPEKLQALAKDYQTDLQEIEKAAGQYQLRPEFVVESAKKNLHLAASLIGEIYTRKKNELLIEGLYDNAPCGYHSLDKDGNILLMNNTELAWLGYARDEIVGKMNWRRLLTPNGLQTFQENFPKFKKRGYVHNLDIEITRKDGSTLFGLVSATAVYDANDNFLMSRSNLVDISDRKQAEETNERLIKILDTTPDFVGFADARDSRILYINRAGRAMTGLGADEDVTQLKIDDVHPPEMNRMLKEEILPVAIDAGFWRGECEFLRRDGHAIPVSMILLAHKSPGGAVDIFSTISRDITERKRKDAELELHRNHLEQLVEERTAELKKVHERFLHAEKLAALGKMTGSIAHEFNNPLYGVRNVLEQTAEHLAHDAEYKPLLTLAVKECNRMADMIRRLRDFYKPSDGVKVWLDVQQTLDDTALLMKKQLMTRKIQLKKNYAPGLPKIWVVGDQMKQVFLNLLQNADEAIDDAGGNIILTTESVDGVAVKISVEDTGEGISPENMKLIFDPFFSTKAVKGTGLGLSVCHGIVNSMGGKIEVRSEPGKGSIFTVSLPLKGFEVKTT
jgi:PAS domain S-box-containing protein